MLEIIHNHPDHFLFIILLISRIGDVLTTYLVSPTLKLEANPVMRKFRWPFAILSILFAFIAYLDIRLAVFASVLFLLVCASNASKIWMVRLIGEDEYLKLFAGLVRKASILFSLVCFWIPLLFFSLIGLVLILLTQGIAQYAGFGFIFYAVVVGFYSTLFYFRTRKQILKLSNQFSVVIQG